MTTDFFPVRFFFGANTPNGFVGYHHELYDPHNGWRAYLIKSGPGTGKNALLRAVWRRLEAEGFEGEAIFCSSDPHSLDAIVYAQQKLCLIDATAPHILEPSYWGACEQIVPLSACMDERRMYRHQADITAVTDACTAAHARCRRFLSASASLLESNRRIEETACDREKILLAADRLAVREFADPPFSGGGETRRFLSAVTPEGLITFSDTIGALCPRIFSLEDEHGAASALLLTRLRELALSAGLSIITCACPLAPQDKPEHLLIPSLGLAFTTSNSWHRADYPVYRRLHAARFLDTEALKLHRQQLAFNRRAARELLDEAVSASAEAKRLHDRMEMFSGGAMDWTAAEALTAQVADSLAAAAKEAIT